MASPAMLLDVQKLSVDFYTADGPVRAVDEITFSLHEGETLGLVGESGCGKTQSVLGMLSLLDNNGRSQGSARYQGQELIGQKQRDLNRVRGASIAMIFQDPMTALNPHLKIETQLLEVMRQHLTLTPKAARRRARDGLAAVHMPAPERCMQRYPHELSGGQRQRVMIAMSLLCEPKILIADEPTTALDVTVQAEVFELLRELKHRLGMALVLITHDLGVVAQLCERVIVMYAGRIVESGRTRNVFNRPQHPYTQGLLACVPGLEAPADGRLTVIPGGPPPAGVRASGCSFRPRCRFAFTRCEHETPHLSDILKGRSKACHLERLP